MQDAIEKTRMGQNLTMAEMSGLVDSIMLGECDDQQTADLLLALRAKGESVEEIAGAAEAMRKNMTPIRTSRTDLIDTCGTGGDGSATFNISTAAALVAAAAGVAVAKHGNRSITSRTGSADVLAALGVNIEASVASVERCLDELGICFCFAPQLHPSMKHVAPVRKRLGVPTIFNMLGPLCNPAGAAYQLLGVGKPELRPKLSSALGLLGGTHAVVVCGDDGLDEVTLADATQVTEVSAQRRRELRWTPEDFGVSPSDLSPLRVEDPEASAAMIRSVLKGEAGPARDIVVINAAAALWTIGRSDSLKQCASIAAEAVDRGDANRVLLDLAELSHRE